MKITTYSLCLILFLLNVNHAAAQLNWIWAKSGGNNDAWGTRAYGVCTDNENNTYVTGMQDSTNYTSRVFINKYDANGGLKWAKTIGAAGSNNCGESVVADNAGHVYVVGMLNSIFYVAKLDSNGNFIWTRQGGMVQPGQYKWMSACLTGTRLFVTASFYQSNSMYGTFGYTSSASATNLPVVLALDTSGNFIWGYVRELSSHLNNFGGGIEIKTDNNKNIIFISSVRREDTTVPSNFFIYTDLLVSKLDSNGHILWDHEFGDSVYYKWVCYPHALELDNAGNIYIGGSYLTSFQIIPDSIATDGAFLAKLDKNGHVSWAKKMPMVTNQTVQITNISMYPGSDSFLCTGSYGGISHFDSLTLSDTGLGGSKVFVANFDTSGLFRWLLSYGRDSSYLISQAYTATLSNGTYTIAGTFTQSISFDAQHIIADTIYDPMHNSGFFVAKAQAQPSDVFLAIVSKLNFDLFPNPSADFVNINFQNGNEEYSVNIYSGEGAKIYSVQKAKDNIHIDTRGWAGGIYYVEVAGNDAKLVKPVVIIR